jgi:hypothetical protein
MKNIQHKLSEETLALVSISEEMTLKPVGIYLMNQIKILNTIFQARDI